MPKPIKPYRRNSDRCAVKGCGGAYEAKGFCGTHYRRFLKGYLTDEEKKDRRRRRPAVCTVSTCNEPHLALGYCDNHRYRLLNGLPLDTPVRTKRTAADVCFRDELGRKQCVRCFGWFSEESFGKVLRQPDKLDGRCIECVKIRNRTHRLKRQYKLTPAALQSLLAGQGGKCAICDRGITTSNCHIDHDHSCCSGRETCGACVRGLLCNGCNTGLGSFRDSPQALARAVDYLQSWPLRTISA